MSVDVLRVTGTLVLISAIAAVTIILLRAWRIASELNRFFSPARPSPTRSKADRTDGAVEAQGQSCPKPERLA
jgi:hypothetical protein